MKRTRRFLSIFLAVMLTLTTVGWDGVVAHADDYEGDFVDKTLTFSECNIVDDGQQVVNISFKIGENGEWNDIPADYDGNYSHEEMVPEDTDVFVRLESLNDSYDYDTSNAEVYLYNDGEIADGQPLSDFMSDDIYCVSSEGYAYVEIRGIGFQSKDITVSEEDPEMLISPELSEDEIEEEAEEICTYDALVIESAKGRLGLLFWIEGLDCLELDPDYIWAGGDEDYPALFANESSVQLGEEWTYFVPGIITDSVGETADVLDNSATLTISKKNGSKWENVTTKVCLTYSGFPESENDIARGLWKFKPYAVGEYKLDAKVNGKTYSAYYNVKLPKVGIFKSSTEFSGNTIVSHDIFQEVGAEENAKSYYLRGYDADNGVPGRLWSINITWPIGSEYYEGLAPISYSYELNAPDRGKSFIYEPTGPDGSWVRTEDCTQIVAAAVKIEPLDSTNTLFKITPQACDAEVEFVYSFDGINNESPADDKLDADTFRFLPSQKGLVLNEFPKSTATDGVYSSNIIDGYEYNYVKNKELRIGETCAFALALNNNTGWVSEQNKPTRITSAAGINAYKVGAEDALLPIDDTTTFKLTSNNVFVFCSQKAGEYRIVYTDGSYVTIDVKKTSSGFYRAEIDGDTYKFNDSNALRDNKSRLTSQEAISGEMEFYAVVDGNALDEDFQPVVIVRQERHGYNAHREDVKPQEEVIEVIGELAGSQSANVVMGGGATISEGVLTDGGSGLTQNEWLIIDSANEEAEDKSSDISYEKITGKDIYIDGQKSNNAIVYKITVKRTEHLELSKRDFEMLFALGNEDDIDEVKKDPDYYIYGMSPEISRFNMLPADFSKAQVTILNGESKAPEWDEGYFYPTYLNKDDVEATIDGRKITDSSLYTITFTTQHTYPGRVGLNVRGISDFEGSVIGFFNIDKMNLGDLSDYDLYAALTYSALDKSVIFKSFDSVLFQFKEGVDYTISGFENITSETESCDVQLTVTAKPDNAYLKGSKTITAHYDKPSDMSCPGAISVPYDGTEKKPSFNVTSEGVQLVEGTDYEVVYPTIKDASTSDNPYEITVKGMGYFEGVTRKVKVYVEPVDITKAEVTNIPKSVDFGADLTDIKNAVTVKLNRSVVLEQGTDYEIIMTSDEVGAQTLTVEGKGNYAGTITKPYTVKAAIALKSGNSRIVLKDPAKKFVYPNAPTADDFKVEIKGATSFGDLDSEYYDISVASTDKVGTIKVTATGKADKGYEGTISYNAKYVAKTIELSDLWDDDHQPNDSYIYTLKGKHLDSDLAASALKAGVDYKVAYKNDTKAGKATASFTGIGNYTGTVTYTYTVEPYDIRYATVSNVQETGTFYVEKAGAAADFKITDIIVINGYSETINKNDYTVTCDEGVKKFVAGETGSFCYHFTVTGKGNCTGTQNYTVTVGNLGKTDISKFTVKIDGKVKPFTFLYNPDCMISLRTDMIEVYNGDTELNKDSDYYIVYDDDFVGNNSFAICGIGEYCGTITAEYKVNPFPINADNKNRITMQSSVSSLVAGSKFIINPNGKVDYGDITIMYDGNELANSDYTYSFKAKKVANGEPVTLTVNFKGNYSGKLEFSESDLRSMNIDPNLYGTEISADEGNLAISGTTEYTYTGNDISPKLNVTAFGKKLSAGKDYTLQYTPVDRRGCVATDNYGQTLIVDNLQDVGRYLININGCGNYSGSYCIEDFIVSVNEASIDKASITLEKNSYNYDKDERDCLNSRGERVGFGKVTTVKLGSKVLVEGRDYDVDIFYNNKPGTAYVEIRGKGNYSGVATKTFTINGSVDINSEDIEVYVDKEAEYSPAKKGAIPDVGVFFGGERLEMDKDYTLVLSNNKSISSTGDYATVQIKGIGKYKGQTATKYPFKVVKRKISDIVIRGYDLIKNKSFEYGNAKIIHEAYADYWYYAEGTTYTGSPLTYDPKIKLDGIALKKDTDYSIYFVPIEEESELNRATDFESSYGTSVRDAGLYAAVAVYKGNYEGFTRSLFIVAPKDISKVSVKTSDVNYTGEYPVGVIKSVTDGKNALVEKNSYYIYYDQKVEKCYIESVYYDDYVFSAEELKKVLKIEFPTGNYKFGNDYVSAGKRTAYLAGKGNYAGVKEVTYNIKGNDIKKLKTSLNKSTVTYNPFGTEKPLVSAAYTGDNGVTYRYEDADMIKNFTNADKAGTATVNVSHKAYTGSAKLTYKVLPYAITEESADILMSSENEYNSAQGAIPYIEICIENDEGSERVTLTEGVDYTVSYKNNKAVTTADKKAEATIKFKGNYSGVITKTFDIVPSGIDKVQCTAGSTWKPSLKVTDTNGKVLKENTDYTVKYIYGDECWIRVGKDVIYRCSGNDVGPKDIVPMGAYLGCLIEGKGNYQNGVGVEFEYMGKNTHYGYFY